MATKKDMNSRPGSSVSVHQNIAFEGDPMSSQTCLHGQKAGQKSEKHQPIIKRLIHAFWATRQTTDVTISSDVLVRTTLKELVIYIVYLVVISIITFGMTNPINYYFTNVMMNLFLTQNTDSGAGVSFNSIGAIQDFWDVTQGPILDGLYWENWYNEEVTNLSQQNFIYFENKLLGVPRLRQLRVKNGSCKVHPLFQKTIYSCYDSYSYFSEDQSPFGIYAVNQTNMNQTAFFYQSSNIVNAPIVSGLISTYGGGGYVVNLDLTKNKSSDILNYLNSNNWIDRGTRVVFLDFTLYNANINMFCQIRLITEFPSTGGALPSWTFRTVKLIRYVTPMDYFVLACEIIFVLFVIYYTIEEALEIRIHKLKYFKEVWNCLDVIVIIISYICISFNIYRSIKVSQILDSLLINSNVYPEFDSLSYWQQQFNNAVAITAFLCWIKIFKYISFNKTMTQLSSTLGRCAKDILGFSVMFFIVFFAYAQLGYLMFGSIVPDYSTFPTTMFTLYRIILGDFDFPTLESSYKIMGPIYFLSYVFFVFFVLLNMFLAIINDTYSDVKSDIANSKSDFELTQYFKRGYEKILGKMNLKKDKIVDIQNILDTEAQSGSTLDFEKWRKELRGRGYTDTEIEAYFSKYDQDGNRNLSAEEQEAMRNDLKKQSEDIDKEMNQYKDEQDLEPQEMTPEEIEQQEAERKANLVSHEEFKILTARVDTMESSIGNIVNKIDSVLNRLESIERAKLKRREAMAQILDKLNEANATQDNLKRIQIQKMVKDELEKWDEPLSSTPGFNSRAASPRVYSPTENIGKKNAWRQL